MREDIDIEGLKARLLARREELLANAQSREEAGRTVELDQGRTGRLTRMDALQGQAMAQAGQRRAALELQRIDAALKRIENGDYGYCAKCDEDIAAGRLEADPATPFCLECAEEAGR